MRFSQMLLNKGELDGVRLLEGRDRRVDDDERLADAILKGRAATSAGVSRNVDVVVGDRARAATSRRLANTGGTARRGRSSPLIPRRSWSSH